MGVSASTSQAAQSEGDHFARIINPNKKAKSKDAQMAVVSAVSSVPQIDYRARIVKRLLIDRLWDDFLSGTYASFALSYTETSTLLKSSIPLSYEDENGAKITVDPAIVEKEVNDYVQLVTELAEKEQSKAIDFMSIIASVLLFSDVNIEEKIDKLYYWIVLGESDSFKFDQFVVALASFEKGLSHALGKIACTDPYIRTVATQWIALADPQQKGSANSNTEISRKNFFDFCTNRQHVVRRLLEGLVNAIVPSETVASSEVVTATAFSKESKAAVAASGSGSEGSSSSSALDDAPSGGDEWMANPAWKKTAEKMTPKTAQMKNIKPDSSLSLEWVHGYRGFDCRNNLGYLCDDSHIIFHAAGLVIAQETRTTPAPSQYFFGEHTDDITSLAYWQDPSDSSVLVATGEMGKTPTICLTRWIKASGSMRCESKAIMKGFHKKGIAQLVFSADGKRLFSVGVEYSVAIYDTDNTKNNLGKVVWSGQGPKEKVLHCSPAGGASEYHFVSCGEKHACFWQFDGKAYKQENCKLKGHKNKMFLCAGLVDGGHVALSTSEGDILFLKGVDIAKEVKLEPHSKSINSMWCSRDGRYMVTGCKDGHIVVSEVACSGSAIAHTKYMAFNASSAVNFPISTSVSIRSIALSPSNNKIVIGTANCDIMELALIGNATTANPTFLLPVSGSPSVSCVCLNRGHFKDELWGLAVRPIPSGAHQAWTTGDDGTLRMWDMTTRRQRFMLDLQGVSRCCAFSSDGVFLAVGFGGGSGGKADKAKETGIVRIYRVDGEFPPEGDAEGKQWINVVAEIKESKQWISVVKFSPDGTYLAVGARDNSIYIYSVIQQFKRKAKFSKHSSGINQLDFSICGKYLQSCCSAYEILYSEVTTGNQITNASSTLIDTEWATWTCTLGWPVLGIWTNDMDGSDVNAVDRSPTTNLIATADDFGKVKIFKYPAMQDGGNVHCMYTGHSSHVTNVKWISDTCLVTCGGNDKCVFVWRNTYPEGSLKAGKSETVGNNVSESHGGGIEGMDSLDEVPSGGDEFTAVKPWLGAIVAPTAWSTPDPAKVGPYLAALGDFATHHQELRRAKDNSVYTKVAESAKTVFQRMSESGVTNNSAPENDELELEWIHGYRGFDMRNNVNLIYDIQSDNLNAVYTAAALGVVYNFKTNKQRYFRGHTDDIMSIAVYGAKSSHPIVATGQQAMANTYVWNPDTMQTLAVLATKQKSVNNLGFSQDGRLLISLAEDKTIAISDWKSQTVLVSTKGEGSLTHHMCPVLASGTDTNSSQFVTCGDKYIKMWTLSGRNLTGNKISTSGGQCGPQNFLSCTEVGSKLLITGEDGFVYVSIDGKSIAYRLDHHSADEITALGKNGGAITSIFFDDDQNVLLTGAKNGTIAVWDVTHFKTKGEEVERAVESEEKGNKGKKDGKAAAAVKAPSKVPVIKPNIIHKFDINSVKGIKISAKQIQSVSTIRCKSEDEIVILVSTRGCDMILLTLIRSTLEISARVVTSGHCNDELWGAATHPSLPEFCTVGDDKTLRFFSLRDKNVTASVSLGIISRTCVYNPSGDLLAIGCGGRVGKGKEAGGGVVRIYKATWKDPNTNEANPELVIKLAERKDAKEWISDVKFSVDGRTLVAGAHDCKIYIYEVVYDGTTCTLNLKSTFSKHNSVINHVDLSADGRFMQSNCSAYELLFCDVGTGKQITSASELKDVKWDTWTCTLGWPVQGIWSPGMDGSDINAVDRSHSGHLVATGDDFGKVKIFRYPCTKENAASLSYSGHSSHVMNVKWTLGDEYLISCGGNDKCIMMWRHNITDINGSSSVTASNSVVLVEDIGGGSASSVVSDDHGGFEAPSGGDESGAVKPWLGAIKPPKYPPPISNTAPNINLSLRWVHGYTSASAGASNAKISNNLFYNSSGDLIYPAAALGIKLHRDKDQNQEQVLTQTYFKGHDDDVLCLAVSNDRRFVATGQTASKASKGKGSICIWDAQECRQLTRMDACHARGVVSVSFNSEGNQLVSIGLDDSNTHILWTDIGGNWSRVQKTSEEKGDKGTIFFSKFVHKDNPMFKNEYQFISGGANSIAFWKLEGAKLSKKPGRFGKYKQVPILCVANLVSNGQYRVVMGTSSGDLFMFEEREVTSGIEKAHSGAVLSLREGSNDCSFLVSGGKDKTIKVWNHALQAVSRFDVSPFSVVDGAVASIDVSYESQGEYLTLIAGTYGGEVIEVTTNVGNDSSSSSKTTNKLDISNAKGTVLVYSHFSGELWGVATHPLNSDIVATAGDDSTLRIWSISKGKMVKSVKLGWPARCVTWHHTGMAIAVGFHEATKGGGGGKKKTANKGKATTEDSSEGNNGPAHDGAVHIYTFQEDEANNAYEVEKVADFCASQAWIQEVRFSPNGLFLAVCSHDKRMYIYRIPPLDSIDTWKAQVKDTVSKAVWEFNKHSSAVLHMDFTSDNAYFMTNCQAGELLFGNLETLKQETSATKLANYNDFPECTEEGHVGVWATQTCKLGWAVQGIFPPNSDLTDINSVDRDRSWKYLATADDFGKVKVFRYPCVQEGAPSVAGDGHSSHVTGVRWTGAGGLVTVGGNDKCLFVWDVSVK